MPFKELLRARFASAITSIPQGIWKVLITDSYSNKLLEAAYETNEILGMNVTSIEPLHSPRGPEQLDAIYLLTPTAQNVNRLIEDFHGRKTYKSAHVYFIDGIDDKLANRLTETLQPLGVLQAFVELYCNFQAIEEQVFSLETPSAFFSMYGQLGGSVSADFAMEAFQDDLEVAGRQIINVLATLNENPYIRYYQPSHHGPLGPLSDKGAHSSRVPPPQQEQRNPNSLRWRAAMGSSSSSNEPVGDYLSKKIAMNVQKDLDEYMANNPEFPAASERPRGVLFVVDRAMDPVAPILHEFWYQAMVNDLLKIDGGKRYKYKYENTVGGKETREAIFDEKDEVWMSVRILHMKDAIDTLMSDFARFAQEHAGFRGNANNVQINDLKDMMASLPQFQTQRDQFSLHLDMAQECMTIATKNKLIAAANVEQCCATGYTPEGKTPKTIVEEMVPLLDDNSLANMDKVRIIALYIIFRDGVADEDRRRLYQHARLSISEQDMVNNLVHLGVKVVKEKEKDKFRGSRIKQKFSHQEDSYDTARYKPVVGMMLEDHSSNKLDRHQFPFLRDTPPEMATSLRNGPPQPSTVHGQSLRSARPTWHKATSARGGSEGKQRLIVFVAGGVTYSEIRQAYVLGKLLHKDIYIGSTHIITPEKFIKDLRALGRGGIGGNPPEGMPWHRDAPGRPDWRNPGEPLPYQAILDMRYWEPPVGAPPIAPPPLQPPAKGGKSKSSHGQPPLHTAFSDLSLSSSHDSRGSKKDKDGEKEKRKLFKMRWGSKDH